MHNHHSWEPGETCWVSGCGPWPLAHNGASALPCHWHWRAQGSGPGWDGPKVLPDVAAPVLSFYLLLHCGIISFRWWQQCEIFQEPQRFLESWDRRGRGGEKGCDFFQILFWLLFAWVFSPWGVPSSLFQAGFCLWEIPMKQSDDLRVCEMLLYFES